MKTFGARTIPRRSIALLVNREYFLKHSRLTLPDRGPPTCWPRGWLVIGGQYRNRRVESGSDRPLQDFVFFSRNGIASRD